MKKTSVSSLWIEVPDEVYLAAANHAMSTEFNSTWDVVRALSPDVSQYAAGISGGLQSTVVRKARDSYGLTGWDIFRKEISEEQAKGLCAVVLEELKNNIFYLNEPKRVESRYIQFDFTEDSRNSGQEAGFQSYQMGGSISQAQKISKCSFDKVSYLLALRNGLRNHFITQYGLPVESSYLSVEETVDIFSSSEDERNAGSSLVSA